MKPDIVAKVIESKEKKIRVSPQHTNRASSIGHPCQRFLVYCRTNWKDRKKHSPDLEFIFEGGRMIEDMAIRELQDAGYQVIEQQRALEWPEMELTGHLDGKVILDGEAIPFDVKSINPWDFDRMNTVEDFLNSKRPYTKSYPAQLMMYMMESNTDIGFLYLKNKLTYKPKVIWVDMDWEYYESILKKLERINKHIQDETLPEQVNDPDLCTSCAFEHICLPSISMPNNMEIIDDEELESSLERLDELKPVKKEYDSLNRWVKKQIEGVQTGVVGDFMIGGKWIERGEYTVKASKYWKPTIRRLE